MRLKSSSCLIFLALFSFMTVTIQYSCTDPVKEQLEEKEKEPKQEEKEEKPDSIKEEHNFTANIASFLEYYPSGDFSDFAALVKRTDLWNALSGNDIYTCFVPTNSALSQYLQEQYDVASIQAVPDSICAAIAKRHLIKAAIYLQDIHEDNGTLSTPNLLNEELSYTIVYDSVFSADGDILYKKYIINNSVVIMVDDTVGNGVVHIIDRVIDNSGSQELVSFIPGLLSSNNKTAPDNLKATIFYQALVATHLNDSLDQYIDANYPVVGYDSTLACYLETGRTASSYRTAFETETVVYPEKRFFKYTLFAVTDATLKSQYGINSLADLRNKAIEVYGGDASLSDYEKESALFKLISYHILPCWLTYDQFNTSQEEIINQRVMRAEFDVEDFYETMHPYAIMRISTPLDSMVEKKGIYINRKGTVSCNNLTYAGIRIWEPSEYGNMDCTALNGGYHFIDKLLFFDSDTKSALNTRIRVMANTLSPDFINSGARGRLHNTGPESNVVYGFKKGFCKNVEWNEGTGFYVRYRDKQFTCLYGDEMTIRGDYDITFRLPPVPHDGTYEIRVWGNPMPDYCNDRGVAQFYFKRGNDAFKECGDPIDMSIWGTDPKIGLIKDSEIWDNAELSEEEKKAQVLANDLLMRSNGYMKGVDCYTTNHNTTLRDYENCYRIIICKETMLAGTDYYLRLRHTDGGDVCPFNFIEIVPQSVFDVNEDKH